MTELVEIKILVPAENEDYFRYLAEDKREEWKVLNFGIDAEFITWDLVEVGDTISIAGEEPATVTGIGKSVFEPWMRTLCMNGRYDTRAEDDYEVVLISRA